MDSSSRLRPYTDTNNAVKITFQKGEKVEAIWSTDGQRYPGTIVHVYPNDNYEVLFNDGVKSRKKVTQIFKLKIKKRPTRFLPKNLPPAVQGQGTQKPLPKLIHVNPILENVPSSGEKFQKMPPNLNKSISNSNNESDSQSPIITTTTSYKLPPPPPPPISVEETARPSTTLNSNSTKNYPNISNNNSSSSKAELIPEDPGGNPGPATTLTSLPPSDPNSVGLCTKKGFVYVQQPHYSVFDIPPTDLGKRRRRVHNYSRLAKGPPLKGVIDSNVDGLIDGESSSQPASPASSVSTGRSSPVDPVVVGASMNNRRKRSSTALINNTNNSVNVNVKKVTPNRTPNSKKFDGIESISSPTPVAVCNNNRTTCSKSVCDTEKSKSVQLTEATESHSKVNSPQVKTKNLNNVEAATPVNVGIEQEAGSGIPSKRLRKPSTRFSADEGYMDIFSSRRTKRTTLSPKEPSTPATPSTNDITPKLQVQRPRSKNKHHLASKTTKDTKELEPPVLFPETEQVQQTEVEHEKLNDKSKEINNCDQQTSAQNSGASLPVDKNVSVFSNDINKSKAFDSSENEELLDVGEYMVSPVVEGEHRSPTVSLHDSKLISPVALSPVIVNSTSPKISPRPTDDTVPPSSTFSKDSTPETSPSSPAACSSKSPVSKHRGRGRRWPEKLTSSKTKTISSENLQQMPSVVLNRLSIPEVHIMVEKCDSVLRGASSSSTCLPINTKAEVIPEVKDDENRTIGPINADIVAASPYNSSPAGSWKRKKRWGDSKHKWTKPRHKTGGLLPGMRPGMRVKDSLSLQLIKRSRLQRRFEKRGRPKLALLTGITKKKLRKIQESIRKRKLKKTNIVALTKFKDVRVDIINCVCGRVDEFGLMIQCEVCFCWQHGVCFHIQDSSKLPKFYVCQSCRSPKSVRSSRVTEAERQEAYKKGVLPFYPFGPKPSTRKQKILKACDELTKVINSIDDSIRQNKIKEQIALSEPDHPKLYQWSTQRPIPKDQIQRWHFNKYFKSVLRRLMSRHKKNPAYLDKLRNLVNFRDKLKKYSQAFEEARLAIRRKIGPRGLILIEKLSEHQGKIDKISKAKLQYNPQFRTQSVQIDKSSVIESPSLPPPPGRENDEKVNEKKVISGISNKVKHGISLAEQLERLTERYEHLCDHTGSVQSEDSDFEETETDSDPDEIYENSLNNSNNNSSTVDVSSIKMEQCDILISKSEEVGNSKVLSVDSDVGMVNGLVKGDISWNPSRESITDDFESDGESALIDDSADGEEYWLQPQTEINQKYNKYRNFLLTDELVEDSEIDDALWIPSKADVIRKDWLWDFDSELGLDDVIGSEETGPSSEYDSTDSSSYELDDDGNGLVEITDDNNENVGSNYWRKAITSLEKHENSDDESDIDWKVEEGVEENSSSETDNESADDDLTIINPHLENLVGKENSQTRINETNITAGIVLLTSDPDAAPGDVVEVVMKEGTNDESIGSGKVIAGGKGQNFIRLIDPVMSVLEMTNQTSNNLSYKLKGTQQQQAGSPKGPHHSRIPLCKSCRESVGSKWTWEELDSSKGIEVVCEDTILSYVQELKKYHTLGLWSAKSNVEVDLNKPCGSLSKIGPYGSQSEILESAFQPMQLKELCREAIKISKHRTESIVLVQDGTRVSSKPTRVNPPTSAEEESILSLLSLSKTPVQFNGENVSELSIESLRRLTDQLQFTNGPLTEGLAKAVGQPLVNGKVGHQNCQNSVHNTKAVVGAKSNSSTRETVCVRCSLKGKSSKTLTVLSTFDPELASTISDDELLELHKELNEAVRKVRASAHVIKRAVFKKVSIIVERMKAEGIARAKGEKVIPISAQGKLALTRPEEYLHGLKSEYVDALLPYATYFISRFTKRDELNKAKKSWVQDMIQKFIMVKKSLKEMYGTGNDEGRIGKEDRFYTALDNLRKSFDIVLTKKDIKMRRQNQNSETMNHLGPNGLRTDAKRVIDSSKSTVPANLVNDDIPEEIEGPNNAVDAQIFSSVNRTSNNGLEKLDPDHSQLSELELLARLATYPIQVEDVDALLGITSKEIGKTCKEYDSPTVVHENVALNGAESRVECKVPDVVSLNQVNIEPQKTEDGKLEPDLQLTNGQEDAMEVDVTNDMKLLEENLELKTSDNLVIGGDMDLIKAIGTFGETEDLKGTEDSDLLLNVFEDPVFSEPPEEPKPCCSKSLTSFIQPPTKQIAPVLMKLTPEMCRGYLIEDIRAHQHVIDIQLDRVESEIMELERRRGKGLKEKEDDKLFSRLYSNMQMLIYNMDVLDRVTQQSVGEDENENDNSGTEGEEVEENDQPDDEYMDEETVDDIDEERGGSSTESCPSEEEGVEQVDVDMDPSNSSDSDVEDLLDI